MQKMNPFGTGGWNRMYVPAGLTDRTLTAIPRPNNDTLYLIAMLDMRDDAVVIQFPAFDSKFVSLETSAYDHYVDIPLSTTKGGGARGSHLTARGAIIRGSFVPKWASSAVGSAHEWHS